MRAETIHELDALFAQIPVLVGGPVSAREIDAAQKELSAVFDADYREFVERYGGAMVGSIPVIGLRAAEVMGDETVVDITRRFRADGWTATDSWIVISVDLGGNPIGLTSSGEVWTFDHDAGETSLVAPTFEEFVIRLLRSTSA